MKMLGGRQDCGCWKALGEEAVNRPEVEDSQETVSLKSACVRCGRRPFIWLGLGLGGELRQRRFIVVVEGNNGTFDGLCGSGVGILSYLL